MAKRIFIWVGHPRAGSLNDALADAYETAARDNGAELRRQNLWDMSFDPHFAGYGDDQAALEPDLLQWQDNIRWADHVLFVHPYWWGGIPAEAKAVFDRALAPGFGFKYRQKGMLWDKLLTGRTGDAIITSDTPPLLDTLLYRSPGRRVMRNQILGFCGVKPRAVLQFGSVKTANMAKINSWLTRAERLGHRAAN